MDTDKTDTHIGADESTSQPAAPSSDTPAKMTPAEMTPAEMTPAEINGPKGPEPTRYGDWEQKGRCSDF
jgi:hypothetical protein